MLPLPPPDLRSRALPLERLRAGRVLFRMHPLDKRAVFFGPPSGWPPTYRFDDPDGAYGVCYLGIHRASAFVETFLRDLSTPVVSIAALSARRMSRVLVHRDLRLVRAHGPGLHALGTTAAISAARLQPAGVAATGVDSYRHAMAWSRALHDHPESPDGILYRSSHDDALECVALYGDRANGALVAQGRGRPVDQLPKLMAAMVRRYGLILLQ